ncbi:DMT family transporter [Inquilinus limosus]|uniref:DMT family transporter n=1 Tax=Inquilinus limosus TaxID=171674 RepID=UPI001B7F99D4
MAEQATGRARTAAGMAKGVALGFLAYALFTFGDANVKALSGRLSVFEIGFFVGVFALAMLPFIRRPGEPWREAFRPKRPGLVAVRVASGICAGLLGMVAFTNLPFAEAYAIIFLAPSFVTILSALILKERVAWQRLAAIALGFGGVLLVVRPGFQELHPAHLAALGTALAMAATVLVLRVIAPVESRVTLLAYPILTGKLVTGPLMLLDFRWPEPIEFGFLALAGLLAAAAQIGLIQATRFAPAHRVGPAQYSQIVWAVVIGAVFFAEIPDGVALAGIGLVLASGLFAFLGRAAA